MITKELAFRHSKVTSSYLSLINPLFAPKKSPMNSRLLRYRGGGNPLRKLSEKPLDIEERQTFKRAKSGTQAKISCSEIEI